MQCKDCYYFRQHYVKFGKYYTKAGCGHCKYPRLKNRRPETPACGNFIQFEEEKDGETER